MTGQVEELRRGAMWVDEESVWCDECWGEGKSNVCIVLPQWGGLHSIDRGGHNKRVLMAHDPVSKSYNKVLKNPMK